MLMVVHAGPGRRKEDSGDSREGSCKLLGPLFEALFGPSHLEGVLLIAGGTSGQLFFADLSHQEPWNSSRRLEKSLKSVPIPPLDQSAAFVHALPCGASKKDVGKISTVGTCLVMVALSGDVCIAYLKAQNLHCVTRKLHGQGTLTACCAISGGLMCIRADGAFWVGLCFDEKGVPSFGTASMLDIPRCVH